MQTLRFSNLQLAIVCTAVGEFTYTRVRIIAGLFWVASFFGFLVALLFSAFC